MLHLETINNRTLELIQRIHQDPYFQEFTLVGGTGLALQIGHRSSVDIDLFSTHSFSVEDYLAYLELNYDFKLQYAQKDTLKGLISGVFLDILTHPYPLVREVIIKEGIRLASMQDIAAFKLNAISLDGTRIKDFVDLYFLLKHFTIQEMLEFYMLKYSQRNVFHVVKSLTYFDQVDTSAWPVMLLERDLDLGRIISAIRIAVQRYIQESSS